MTIQILDGGPPFDAELVEDEFKMLWLHQTNSRGTERPWYSYAMDSHRLLAHAQRLQALAQSGLTYATDLYDRERYEEVRAVSVQLLQALTDEPLEKIIRAFASEDGYPTPKVDVRAVVLRKGAEVLLVQETLDSGRWTLPGGWADIGYTPCEI